MIYINDLLTYLLSCDYNRISKFIIYHLLPFNGLKGQSQFLLSVLITHFYIIFIYILSYNLIIHRSVFLLVILYIQLFLLVILYIQFAFQ